MVNIEDFDDGEKVSVHGAEKVAIEGFFDLAKEWIENGDTAQGIEMMRAWGLMTQLMERQGAGKVVEVEVNGGDEPYHLCKGEPDPRDNKVMHIKWLRGRYGFSLHDSKAFTEARIEVLEGLIGKSV